MILCMTKDVFSASDRTDSWANLKDKHFIVYYEVKEDESLARLVLRNAEDYYEKIANQIGYARYSNFWTWDERAKIIVFSSQEAFMRETGQPAWSKGGSSGRDLRLLQSRVIITFRQEEDFLDGLLPHEIGHLILRDFVGFNTKLPLWFEEGVAQLQEKGKKERVAGVIKTIVKGKERIPFDILMNLDIRKEEDSKKVSIFYAQSLSIIDFMIRSYGSSNFGTFCRSLKSGHGWQEALPLSFSTFIHSMDDLEKKWLASVS